MSTLPLRADSAASNVSALHGVLQQALQRRSANIPARPASLIGMDARFGADPANAPVDLALLGALSGVREALYRCPGRAAEVGLLWREAVATAFLAGHVASMNGASTANAGFAGLLHRAGEALVLQALAETEHVRGQRVDGALRARLTAAHEAQLSSALIAAWRLPTITALAMAGWRHVAERGAASAESIAVHIAHMLAVEMLYPQFCAPGLAGAVAAEAQVTPAQLDSLRSQRPVLELLLERC